MRVNQTVESVTACECVQLNFRFLQMVVASAGMQQETMKGKQKFSRICVEPMDDGSMDPPPPPPGVSFFLLVFFLSFFFYCLNVEGSRVVHTRAHLGESFVSRAETEKQRRVCTTSWMGLNRFQIPRARELDKSTLYFHVRCTDVLVHCISALQ